jgi:allantoicase
MAPKDPMPDFTWLPDLALRLLGGAVIWANDDANDWVRIRLAGAGRIRLAEIDTSHFVGNSPGAASLSGLRDDGTWIELLPRTELLPDGGLARLRHFGDLA